MEFLLALSALIAVLFAWRRIDRTDQAVNRLTDEVLFLRSFVAELRHAVPPTDVSEAAPPEAPSVPAPAAAPAAPVRAAAEPSAPAAIPGWAVSAPRRMGRPAVAMDVRGPLAPAGTLETLGQLPVTAASAEPAGPGPLARLLATAGLVPPEPGEGWSRGAIEAWLEGRMLAVVGGAALLLGAIFFLSLAFSRGWIGPEARVVIGLVIGAGLVVGGELLFRRAQTVLAHVLIAVGLATVSLAFYAATRLYGLVPVEAGLAGAFVAALVAAAIAVRHDSQLVAAFGLVAVLGAPPILGASPTLVTLAFVAVTLAGTAAIALFRTWRWLPVIAFVLTVPQLASYIDGSPPVTEGLIALAGFWLINTIAAGGEEFRRPTDSLRPTTVTLLLADAAFILWAGFALLSGDAASGRGAFLATVAAAHLAMGLGFLVRYGDRHPFGLVVGVTGIAALTMAIPVQFGGPPVPIAWAAEAVALGWLATIRRHPYSAGLALILAGLAIGHLVAIEYPSDRMAIGLANAVPFIGPEGLTFAFLIGAGVLAAVLIPVGWIRAWLAIAGGALALYVFPFELSGPALVGGWSALAVAAVVVGRPIVAARLGHSPAEVAVSALALPAVLRGPAAGAATFLRGNASPGFLAVGAAGSLAALAHLLVLDYPVDRLGAGVISAPPFVGLEGLSLLIVVVALAVAGWLLGQRWIRLACAGLGLALITHTVAFEVPLPWLIGAWAILALAALALVRRVVLVAPIPVLTGGPARRSAARPVMDAEAVGERLPYLAAALALVSIAVEALREATPWGVLEAAAGGRVTPSTPFVDQPTLVLAILAATLVGLGLVWGGRIAPFVAATAAGLVVAWLLPVEVGPAASVVGWSGLAVGGLLLLRLEPSARPLLGGAAVGLLAVAALVGLAVVAPPDRLLVDATSRIDHPLLISQASAALGALAVAFAVGGRLHPAERLSLWALGAAAVVGVYLLSVGVVDEFQRQVGQRPLEELQQFAQVGLSVTWSVLGGCAFAVGLLIRRAPVRLSGLALLGLATLKVFLVDLAGMDVAFRVLSLVGLGVLLLLSAFVYSHLQRPHGPGRPRLT